MGRFLGPPLCILSAPAAWVGGRIAVPEEVFTGALGGTLLAASLFMAIDPPGAGEVERSKRRLALPIAVGGGIGFLSGLVGIGGGIFLAPFLHLIRWGRAHEIAGAASVFILVNSLFGLWGQTTKLGDVGKLAALADYWPLPIAVLVGGAIGGFIGARKLPAGAVKKVTAVLILIVSRHPLADAQDPPGDLCETRRPSQDRAPDAAYGNSGLRD